MNLKFIGTDGSMGLKHGEVYDILIDPDYKFDGIIIKWVGADANLHTCPYFSPAAFAANWVRPGQPQKVVVRKKSKTVGPVKHGRWRIETDEEEPNLMFKLVACSTCNRKANMMYAYCPHCGAKMDGGAENG